jgi:hypothetical protein
VGEQGGETRSGHEREHFLVQVAPRHRTVSSERRAGQQQRRRRNKRRGERRRRALRQQRGGGRRSARKGRRAKSEKARVVWRMCDQHCRPPGGVRPAHGTPPRVVLAVRAVQRKRATQAPPRRRAWRAAAQWAATRRR